MLFRSTQGTQGTQGLSNQGSQGTQGLQGFQGIQGTQGNQGFQGVLGEEGLQGTQGLHGMQGLSNQGAQGSQGTQGLIGPIAGSDKQIIFNDDGSSGASTLLTFDKENTRLGIGTTALFSTLQVEDFGVSVDTGSFTAVAGESISIDEYLFLQSDGDIHKVYEYTLYVQNSVGIQVQKILLMTDGVYAYHQEYAIMNTSSPLVQVVSDLQAGSSTTDSLLDLKIVPKTGISGITTYKYVRKVLI